MQSAIGILTALNLVSGQPHPIAMRLFYARKTA